MLVPQMRRESRIGLGLGRQLGDDVGQDCLAAQTVAPLEE